MFWDILLDAFIDTIKVLPILYLVYLLVSYIGHNNNNKYTNLMSKTKKFGPVIGGVTGCIPQCGFSIVMSDLYSRKAITLGTLIAVFIATSDEALPLMVSKPNMILPLLIMMGIKLVVAIFFGYLFDFVLKLFGKKQQTNAEVFSQVHCHECELTSCNHIHKNKTENHQQHSHDLGHCCGGEHHDHSNHDHCCADNIFLDALIHTLKISAFLFVASLIIGLIVEFAGIENLALIFGGNKFIQPLVSALVGLIPSCASSVFLVEFYMAGGISFGALVGGLCAGSGIGILVLFSKNKKHIWTNIIILISLYLIGVAVGEICNLLPLVF